MSIFAGRYWGGIFGGVYFGGAGAGTGTGDAFPRSSMLIEDGVWHFKVYLGDVAVVDFDCGLGYDEADIPTLGELADVVNAVSGLNMAVPGEIENEPAAFIPSYIETAFEDDTTLELTYYVWEQVPVPDGVATLFSGLAAIRYDDRFEIASFETMRDVCYIGTGYDAVVKYDGVKAYIISSPPAGDVLAVAIDPGFITGTDLTYMIAFVPFDATGKEVQGLVSAPSNEIDPVSNSVSLTFETILTDSGFNTDYAVSAAAPLVQVGEVINLAPGYTLKTGDYIFFKDSNGDDQFRYVELISPDLDLLILDSEASVAADTVFSCIMVRVWGQIIADGTFLFQGDYAHDPTSITQTITFSEPPNGPAYIAPDVAPTASPPLKYLRGYQDRLCGAVDETVYVSDVLSAEIFSPSSSFDVVSTAGPIKALSPVSSFFCVFKENSYYVVVGTIGEESFRVDLESRNIGCQAHASIQDIGGPILFLDRKGIHLKDQSALAVNISDNLFPRWRDPKFIKKRAISVQDSDEQGYVLFLPVETNNSPAATHESRVLVYNWYFQAWWEYTNVNNAAGATARGSEIWWAERKISTFDNQEYSRTQRKLILNNYADFTDHGTPIPFEYTPGWVHLDEPTQLKKYVRFKLYSNDPFKVASFTLQVSVEYDFLDAVSGCSFPLVFGTGNAGEGWGADPWSYFPWGHPTQPFLELHLKNGRAKAARPVFTHEENYRFPLITGWEYQIEVPYQLRIANR